MLKRNYRKTKHRNPEEEVELYNLETDPGEYENIASVYPDIANYEKMALSAMGLQHWVLVSL
jgi:hypothetical protein